MQTVILAGGLAMRLRPLTDKVPKSLLQIAGKPFVEYQLNFLRKNGVRDIVFCVGHGGEKIEKYCGDGRIFGVTLRYSYEKGQLLGTAGALKNAEHLLGNQFFVMYGDSFLSLDFIAMMSYFTKLGKMGLMAVYKNLDQYDRSNVVIEGDMVKQYSNQDKTKAMVYIDYGASILKKRALKLVPSKSVYSLEELFRQLIEKKELLAYEVSQRFYQIGSREGLEEFKEYVSRVGVLP